MTSFQPPTPATSDGQLLVCAHAPGRPEPLVLLADGSYESADERVFWGGTPDCEVLRVPLAGPVAVRQVRHFPAQRPSADGERRLLAAIAAQRRSDETVPAEIGATRAGLARQLAQALTDGHEATAESLATLLRLQVGLGGMHAAITSALAKAGADWAADGASLLRIRTMARTAQSLLERLRPATDIPVGSPCVVLATPPGDQHTLGLAALSHQLHEAGYACQVVDDLPLEDLAALMGQRPVQAVVVSAHVTFSDPAARRYFAALRKAGPGTLLVAGGPGAPRQLRNADLVTSDPAILLRALGDHANVLTRRECEILRDVADGLTNNEIAGHLGLSPSTVKTHLDRVFAKTGTEHRAAAVARALRQGWIG